jgi:sec-independent protein translocase protein TatA
MVEMLIILFVVVLLFGANRLPQLGDGLGKAIRNFRAASRGEGEKPAARKELPPGGTA